MKKITIILIFFMTKLFCQDTVMLRYINEYRAFNGKNQCIFTQKLNNIAKTHALLMVSKDSLFHSHLTNEVIARNKSLPSSAIEKQEFITFIKTVFKVDYSEPIKNSEVISYVKLYVIFMYDRSQKHKTILLNDYTNIGCYLDIQNIKFVYNTFVVMGKTIEHKNMISHYDVTFYSVINLE